MNTYPESINWTPGTLQPGEHKWRNVECNTMPGWPILAEFTGPGSDTPDIQVYARSMTEGGGTARVFIRNNHPTQPVTLGAGTVYLVAFDPRPAAEEVSLDPLS